MRHDHFVTLERDKRPSGTRRQRFRYLYRAVCRCGWSSPWRTTAPAFPDGRERSWLTPRSVIIRVAGEHIRTVTRRVPANRVTGG